MTLPRDVFCLLLLVCFLVPASVQDSLLTPTKMTECGADDDDPVMDDFYLWLWLMGIGFDVEDGITRN